MKFSFKKMGIVTRIKRSRNQELLNFDFGDFLKWMNLLCAVASSSHLGWFMFDFSCLKICGNVLKV